MKFFRRANIVTGLLLFASLAVLAVTFAYNTNITVLKDWQIVLPTGDIHAGDTVIVQSIYTKLRSVKGTAVRYIECKTGTGIYVRYPLSTAIADHAPGVAKGTGFVAKMPTGIPTPASCMISINVTYKVYPWRSVTEFATSRQFTLLSPVSLASVSASATQTNQLPTQSSDSSPVQFSSSNTTPATTPTQSNNVQASPVSTTPSQSALKGVQSLIERLSNNIKEIL